MEKQSKVLERGFVAQVMKEERAISRLVETLLLYFEFK